MSTTTPIRPVAVVDQMDGPVVTVEIAPVGGRPVLLDLPAEAVPGAREGRAYRLVPVEQADPGHVTVASCRWPDCSGGLYQIPAGSSPRARCPSCGERMTALDPEEMTP